MSIKAANMLSQNESEIDYGLELLLGVLKAFSEETFGPGMKTKSIIAHIKEELQEVEDAPTDLSEWADIAILGLDGLWRASKSPKVARDALVSKVWKNINRKWPDIRDQTDGHPVHHCKVGEK